MKKNFLYPIAILLLVIAFLSCTETEPIYLEYKKGPNNEELDYGVSLKPPARFNKGKSFIGYQAPGYAGSIELVMEPDFEAVRKRYSVDALESRNGKIFRYQPVVYNDNNKAFYVEYLDKPQKRYRQALVLSFQDRVYHLKSFHRGKPDNPLSREIRTALMSVYIDDFSVKGKPFSKMFFDKQSRITYTRDNKFPTEEPDSLVSRFEILNKEQLQGLSAKAFLQKRVREICEGCDYVKREDLKNGVFLECNTSCDSKKIIAMLVGDDESFYNLFICEGNEKTDIKETSTLLKSQLLSME